MTSCSNTFVPLGDDGLYYSPRDLTTLNDLSVTDLSWIDTTSIQKHRQAHVQSVELAQHWLANPQVMVTTKVVDRNCLRQQCDQE
jgi:hypothetical protein